MREVTTKLGAGTGTGPDSDDAIRLGQFLKLADVVVVGADVKELLMGETVLVNGVPEQRRGRQLHRGDVISVFGEELRVG